MGGEEDRPACQMDFGSDGGVPLGRARSRPCHACRTRARRGRQDHRLARAYDRQSRRLSLDLRVLRADLSLWDAAFWPIRDPKHLLRSRRGLHQHRARRRLSRRGAPEATFVIERIVEIAARETGQIPPSSGEKVINSFPHQTPVIMAYDAGDYAGALDKALALADHKGLPARKAASAAKGRLRGFFEISAYIEACGIAPSAAVGSLGAGVGLWESAEVRVNPIGTVEVLTGSHSHGQGHETTFAQLVSSRLGVPMENVSIVHGDRQCSDGHGHLWLALWRRWHVGDFQGAG